MNEQQRSGEADRNSLALGEPPLGEPRKPLAEGLTVREVTVKYRLDRDSEITAVSGASFEVAKGELVALTGPSGCGKSTLLRAIGWLEPLAAGSVSWDGEDLHGVAPHRRGFGMIFQDGQLFGHMTVAKNIAYGLAAQKMPREAREQRVEQLLEMVGLVGYGPRAVTELSGGQRQRVVLARSLAPRPRMLMLDEPLSALDRPLRERLVVETAQLLRDAGMTAILVTHDHAEAETFADRVLAMSDGLVLAPRARG